MRERILEIVQRIAPEVNFEKETALIDEGILESFAIIQIVTSFMDEFDIDIDADDIEPENLNSLAAMCELVESKL